MVQQDSQNVAEISPILGELLRFTEALTPEEQLYLAAHLVEAARRSYQPIRPRRRWHEIRGAAPYPLLGQDAQAWVSGTRHADDEPQAGQEDAGA
jgi:hypothetical protein